MSLGCGRRWRLQSVASGLASAGGWGACKKALHPGTRACSLGMLCVLTCCLGTWSPCARCWRVQAQGGGLGHAPSFDTLGGAADCCTRVQASSTFAPQRAWRLRLGRAGSTRLVRGTAPLLMRSFGIVVCVRPGVHVDYLVHAGSAVSRPLGPFHWWLVLLGAGNRQWEMVLWWWAATLVSLPLCLSVGWAPGMTCLHDMQGGE